MIGLWSHLPADMSSVLIDWATRGNYGLAANKWRQQLEQIRALPEAEKS